MRGAVRCRYAAHRHSLLVEAVQAGRVRRQQHPVARFQVEFTDIAAGEHSDFPGIDIEEGVAAEMLGHRHGSRPAFRLLADLQMFGPDPDGGGAVPGGRLAGHEVHLRRSDEAGDEQVCRPLVQFERRAVLFDAAGIEHDDLVSHGHGLDLVMGDVDGGGRKLFLQLGDLHAHLDPKRGVEVRQRLVEQKRLRLAHDGASDRNPLALAAGKLARLSIEIGRQVQRGRGGFHLAIDLGARQPRHLQPERDVAANAHMRIERVGLKHHRQAALRRRNVDDVAAVDQDLAAGDILKSGDQPQQRGLAAPRRPDENHKGAVLDVEIGILDDVDRPERFADPLKRDLAHDSPFR